MKHLSAAPSSDTASSWRRGTPRAIAQRAREAARRRDRRGRRHLREAPRRRAGAPSGRSDLRRSRVAAGRRAGGSWTSSTSRRRPRITRAIAHAAFDARPARAVRKAAGDVDRRGALDAAPRARGRARALSLPQLQARAGDQGRARACWTPGEIGKVHLVTLQTFRNTHAKGVSEWRPNWRRERRIRAAASPWTTAATRSIWRSSGSRATRRRSRRARPRWRRSTPRTISAAA